MKVKSTNKPENPMIEAKCKSELEGALRTLDISVPGRSCGRGKEHVERYAIAIS